jgi:phosphoribosylaminoimidazole-succinocarboxamide synthase
MPDTIANKGLALTLLGAFFFQQLEEKGVATHFKRLVDRDGKEVSLPEAAKKRNVYLEVLKAEVHRPTLKEGKYVYPAHDTTKGTHLVPLEVVFRFGMPPGSSLRARLERNPAYLGELGMTEMPEPDTRWEKPVIEFFTKLEPKDRLLTRSEAFQISGLTPQQWNELQKLAATTAEAVKEIFERKGIELWDGKFEFIIDDGKLLVADSIGPDELRLIYKNVQLSKEIIREYYRGGAWETALQKAQDIAKKNGDEDFKKICIEQLGQQPEPLSPDFKENIDHLYGALTNHVCDEQLLASEPDLETLVQSLSRK